MLNPRSPQPEPAELAAPSTTSLWSHSPSPHYTGPAPPPPPDRPPFVVPIFDDSGDDADSAIPTAATFSNSSAAQPIRRRFRLPPEILTHILRYAYTNSRRQFLNNALVDKEWASCALPVLWERIAPRSNFPLALIVRSLDKLWKTLSRSGQSHDYASFPRAVAIQLHLKNNEFVSRRSTDDFARIVELVPGIIKYFPKVRDLGLTLRVEEISISLQATATAFLERLIRIAPPSASLWLKLAGIAVLDSQCAALAERFGPVLTDLHLTKCMGCTAFGLKYLLKRAPKLQSLALYIPSLHDQLIGTIAQHNNQLMDLWLDLPMEEGAQVNDLESLRHFCEDLHTLMLRSKKLRRLRLRGVPLNSERAHQMLSTVAAEGKDLRSLSVLVWPPVAMGREISTVAFIRLTKLIVSSNNRLSNDFLVAVARSCPKLTYLDAGRTRIDDTCVHEIAARCPLLETLDISRCANPTILALSSLARHAHNLAELDVSFCPKILRSEDLVPFLHLAVGCKRLKRFSIDYPPAGGVVPPEPPVDVGTASETVRLLFSRFGAISTDTADRKRVLNLAALRENWTAAYQAARDAIDSVLARQYTFADAERQRHLLTLPLPPGYQPSAFPLVGGGGPPSSTSPPQSPSAGISLPPITDLAAAPQAIASQPPHFYPMDDTGTDPTVPALSSLGLVPPISAEARMLSEHLRHDPVVRAWLAEVKRVLDGDEEPSPSPNRPPPRPSSSSSSSAAAQNGAPLTLGQIAIDAAVAATSSLPIQPAAAPDAADEHDDDEDDEDGDDDADDDGMSGLDYGLAGGAD
ncbi:hypothetical protein HDU86_006800 [Geranomyces michiganensis]|nr:hypothetical protein HDU86_006800 [Geranomyces michiganensis]